MLDFVRKLELTDDVAELLRKNLVDMPTLTALTEAEMAEIGVPLGARKRLYRALHPPVERDEAEEAMLCVVCLELQSTRIGKECGHKCLCDKCAGKVTACPICRRETVFLKIYTS